MVATKEGEIHICLDNWIRALLFFLMCLKELFDLTMCIHNFDENKKQIEKKPNKRTKKGER